MLCIPHVLMQDDLDQVRAVGEVGVVQRQRWIALMGILIQMIDPISVVREAGRRP